MTPASYIFGIVAALLTLVAVTELLRRQRLKERHAIWWLSFGIIILLLAIFPQILAWLAHALGVSIPLNLLFFVSVIVLFLVSLQHSSEATTLEEKTRRLAEETALLDARVRQLESKLNEKPTHEK